SLATLYDSLPKLYLSRQKVDCPFAKYPQVLAAVREKYAGKKTDELDGLKIFLDNSSWILFRGSGNSPEFKVFAESSNQHHATQLGNQGLDLVKKVLTEVNEPSMAEDSLGVFAAMGKFPKQVGQVLHDMATEHVPASCNLVSNIVVSGMG